MIKYFFDKCVMNVLEILCPSGLSLELNICRSVFQLCVTISLGNQRKGYVSLKTEKSGCS